MRKLVSFILFFICFVFPPPIIAQIPGVEPESRITFGGYIKYMTTYVVPREGTKAWDHLIHQRFNFEYRFSDTLTLGAGMRNRILFGDSLEIPHYDELVTSDTEYLDLSFNWLNRDDVIGNTTFDRLYIDWRSSEWDVRIGRQRINWGMASFWNPNDLFNVYSTFDFDYEERPGTDGILINRTLSWASQVEGVWGFDENWDSTSLAGRYYFNTRGYDIHFLGGKQDIDLVVGTGFAGSIKGAGLNGELSYFHPYQDEWEGAEQIDTVIATMETDYNFPGKRNLTWKGCVLYISDPKDPVNAVTYLNQSLTAKTISFTRWTGYGDIAFDVSSLSRQTLGVSVYDDGSWYSIATNTYSLADDWQLMLVWQHFDGSPESLFGKDPTEMIYVRIRWSF